MYIRELLTEGLSPVLYHRTSLQNFIKIAQTDRYLLTPDIGTDSEVMIRLGQAKERAFKKGDKVKVDNPYSGEKYDGTIVDLDDPDWPEVMSMDGYSQTLPARALSLSIDPNLNKKKKKKIYYMSTSRSKTGEFDKPTKYTSAQAMLVLDGKKLMADGYSGKSINYWHGFSSAANEMEDRIYSTKDSIPDFSKYLTEVHLLVADNDDDDRSNYYRRTARQLKIWGKKHSVPIFIYKDFKNYKLLNKKQDKLDLRTKPRENPPYPSIDRGAFDPHIELLNVDDISKLSDRAMKELRSSRYYDYLSTLKADIHNARRSKERENLDKFISQLKKKNIYSLKDFAEYLNNKFPN